MRAYIGNCQPTRSTPRYRSFSLPLPPSLDHYSISCQWKLVGWQWNISVSFAISRRTCQSIQPFVEPLQPNIDLIAGKSQQSNHKLTFAQALWKLAKLSDNSPLGAVMSDNSVTWPRQQRRQQSHINYRCHSIAFTYTNIHTYNT